MHPLAKPVHTLIFDLGAVLYPITSEHDWVAEHLRPALGDALPVADFIAWFEAFETGTLSAAEFLARVEASAGKVIGMEAFTTALNGRLLEMEAPTVELLRRLSEHYPIYLLSNTNEIHMRTVRERVERRFGQAVFQIYFRDCFLSYELGLRKPDLRIYEAVTRLMGTDDPGGCLFLDDSADNVAGARDFGWQAVLATGDLGDLLRELGLPV